MGETSSDQSGMKSPAISIVVPCYNGGRFLDDLFVSLNQQDFRDFEVIVVDDGSTEQATQDKLNALSSGVKVVRQSNKGLSAARNAGFLAAKADIVLPLDCDDRLDPRFLNEAFERLSKSPNSAFVFSDMKVTGELEGLWPRRFNRFDHLFINRLPYCILIRKSVWQQVGGYDEAMRDGFEDWEFSLRLALNGHTGIAIKEPLFFYYLSPKGMLISRSARMFGTIWSYIRHKHAASYTLSSIRELHEQWKSEARLVGLGRAVAILTAVRIVPDGITNFVFFTVLRTVHWWRGNRRFS